MAGNGASDALQFLQPHLGKQDQAEMGGTLRVEFGDRALAGKAPGEHAR